MLLSEAEAVAGGGNEATAQCALDAVCLLQAASVVLWSDSSGRAGAWGTWTTWLCRYNPQYNPNIGIQLEIDLAPYLFHSKFAPQRTKT